MLKLISVWLAAATVTVAIGWGILACDGGRSVESVADAPVPYATYAEVGTPLERFTLGAEAATNCYGDPDDTMCVDCKRTILKFGAQLKLINHLDSIGCTYDSLGFNWDSTYYSYGAMVYHSDWTLYQCPANNGHYTVLAYYACTLCDSPTACNIDWNWYLSGSCYSCGG